MLKKILPTIEVVKNLWEVRLYVLPYLNADQAALRMAFGVGLFGGELFFIFTTLKGVES